MNIEAFTKIETSKKISNRMAEVNDYFSDFKENKKKPIYNYHSGLTAGLLLRDFSIVMTLKKDTPKNTIGSVRSLAKMLIEEYNWKKDNLQDLLEQCFSEGD